MKSNVGYSTEVESFKSGEETAKKAIIGLTSPKVALTYTSVKFNQEEVIKGIKSVINIPVVGCTSAGAIITNDGIITSENGFSGSLILDDENLSIGVSGMEKQNDARETGRQIALDAIKNSGTLLRPSYFYMVANPSEEESYLKGIQDVIGRVPFFGGSAADDNVTGDWKIFCNDKVFSDGCAVVFFYTNKRAVTEYTGSYNETGVRGIVTKINGRTLMEIDNIPALKKYAEWRNMNPEQLKGLNLLSASIPNPLGVKDPINSLTLIRHPMVGNDDYSMNIGNDLAVGTCINMMTTTQDQLISSTISAINIVNEKLNNNVGAYLLVHCAGRKLGVGNRLNEVYENLKSSCKDTPFISVFTFGEYGYNEHSANSCGGLMLSFTGFEK
ncbi:MAG: FIST signal transduction protein [Bacilli bacterium]